MATAPKPIFLFLLPVQGCVLPVQDPFLAVVSTDGAGVGFLVEHDGDVKEMGKAVDLAIGKALTAKGIRSWPDLQAGMDSGVLTGCFVEGLSCVLQTITADGIDLDASMPDTHDVLGTGAIARTRDTAFWLRNHELGYAAPIEVAAYIEDLIGLDLPQDVAQGLEQAIAMYAPDAVGHFEPDDLLDFFMVGVVNKPTSAHAQMAQRGRVAEDVRLLSHVWAETGEDQRPVVPIFL